MAIVTIAVYCVVHFVTLNNGAMSLNSHVNMNLCVSMCEDVEVSGLVGCSRRMYATWCYCIVFILLQTYMISCNALYV